MTNSKQIIKRIDDLIGKFSNPADPSDVETLREWRKEVEREMLNDSIRETPSIKLVVEKLKDDVAEMTYLLNHAKSQKLPDTERDRIIDKKELYLWFLGIFAGNDKVIEEIEKKVKVEEEFFEQNKESYIS